MRNPFEYICMRVCVLRLTFAEFAKLFGLNVE